MRGNSYNKKVRFREVSQKWQKNDCIKAKKDQKRPFLATKKNVTFSRSCILDKVGPAGRPQIFEILSLCQFDNTALFLITQVMRGVMRVRWGGGKGGHTPTGTRRSASAPPPNIDTQNIDTQNIDTQNIDTQKQHNNLQIKRPN